MFQEEALMRFLLRIKEQIQLNIQIRKLQLSGVICLPFNRVHLHVNLLKASLHQRISKLTSHEIHAIINDK